MKKLKWIGLILIASIVVCSCGKKDKKNTHKSDGFDMAKLLTPEMVRSTYGLEDTVTLEPDFGSSANYIDYDFSLELPDGGVKAYSVALNFYSSTPSSSSALDAMWESQNENVYKDKDMEAVSGVGQKASWSTLAGGQLRVITDKYLFYISQMWGDKDLKKDRAISLAKEIIERL